MGISGEGTTAPKSQSQARQGTPTLEAGMLGAQLVRGERKADWGPLDKRPTEQSPGLHCQAGTHLAQSVSPLWTEVQAYAADPDVPTGQPAHSLAKLIGARSAGHSRLTCAHTPGRSSCSQLLPLTHAHSWPSRNHIPVGPWESQPAH